MRLNKASLAGAPLGIFGLEIGMNILIGKGCPKFTPKERIGKFNLKLEYMEFENFNE